MRFARECKYDQYLFTNNSTFRQSAWGRQICIQHCCGVGVFHFISPHSRADGSGGRLQNQITSTKNTEPRGAAMRSGL